MSENKILHWLYEIKLEFSFFSFIFISANNVIVTGDTSIDVSGAQDSGNFLVQRDLHRHTK